jgi:hypothetical protein
LVTSIQQAAMTRADMPDRAGLPWPGSALTGDDQRRLATMGNTTRLTYCARCQNPIDDGADEIALRIIELRHPDGDIAISVPTPRLLLATDARPVSNPQKDRRSLLPSRAD